MLNPSLPNYQEVRLFGKMLPKHLIEGTLSLKRRPCCSRAVGRDVPRKKGSSPRHSCARGHVLHSSQRRAKGKSEFLGGF